MSFADNLYYLRSRHKFTQERLAVLLGVSRQAVSKWESEHAYPEMDKLLTLCDLFDCTLDELVTGDLRSKNTGDTLKLTPHAGTEHAHSSIEASWGALAQVATPPEDYTGLRRAYAQLRVGNRGRCSCNHCRSGPCHTC